MMISTTRLLLAALALGAAAGSHALPPAPATGEAVSSIPDADRIREWQPLDNRRLLVNMDPEDSYLITLKHQCFGLSWARNVSVTMSNNTIWAGFDEVSADGLACPIDRISKVSGKELLELKKP